MHININVLRKKENHRLMEVCVCVCVLLGTLS